METEPKPVVTGYPAAAAPPPLYASAAATGPAHGTAYAYPAPSYYPAPPPVPYHDPYASRYGDDSHRSAAFLRRLIIISVSVFLAVGFATFILWLVLRPHLPEFAVTSASVSSFSLSTSQLSADFSLTLSVHNRNKKMGIFYDRVEAAVLSGLDLISETSLSPFYQGKGNSTMLLARFAVAAQYIDPDVANALTKDRSDAGGVNFDVSVMTLVRFRAGAWRTRRRVMRVFCNDVRFRLSNTTAAVGSLVGQPKSCKVYL